VKQVLINKIGEKAYAFLNGYLNTEAADTLVISTTNEFNILNHQFLSASPEFVEGSRRAGNSHAIVNLSKVNNIRYINKFFEKVNSRLQHGDWFVVCFRDHYSPQRAPPP
jgi:hypothetical protein